MHFQKKSYANYILSEYYLFIFVTLMHFSYYSSAGILCSCSMVQSLCPDNWVSHGGECYAFVTNIKSTWINAGVMLLNHKQ